MARNQNTWAKRQRELKTKQKAEEKRQRRQQKKELDPSESDAIGAIDLAELDEFGNPIDITSARVEPPNRITQENSSERTDGDS